MDSIIELLDKQALEFILTLILSLLVGMEREGQGQKKQLFFGGIRTYPLLGLSGLILFRLYPHPPAAFIAGLVVIGGFLLIFYLRKIKVGKEGFTTEISGMLTYILGGLVANGSMWLAVAVAIVMILLLQGKNFLGYFVTTIPSYEFSTFMRFLLLVVVILPVVPNKEFTQFNINPFKIWLIVIAVISISYLSYLIQLFLKQRGGVMVTSVLGGIYSSTATTVVLSKKARNTNEDVSSGISLYASAILMASSMMYLRILVLVVLFSQNIFYILLPIMASTGLVGIIVAVLLSIYSRGISQNSKVQEGSSAEEHSGKGKKQKDKKKIQPSPKELAQEKKITPNPLELNVAIVFAVLFLVVFVLNQLALERFGDAGVYTMATIMGFTDVDPFILSIADPNAGVRESIASLAILIAAGANNLLKGVYAVIFSHRKIGIQGLLFLLGLSLLSVLFYFLF